MAGSRKDTSLLCIVDTDTARTIRLANGWTCTDVARRAQFSRSRIGRYESGKTRPTPLLAKAWADALGIGVDQLVVEVVRNLLGRRPARQASAGFVFPAKLVRPGRPSNGAPNGTPGGGA